MKKLIVIAILMSGLSVNAAESVNLRLSGTVKDKGFQLVNGQIKPQEGSNLILTVNKNKVVVKAK